MEQEEEIKKQERERIIRLIDMERDHHDMGVSLALGRLIDAIRGEDELHKEWLEKEDARTKKRDRFLREIGFDGFDTGYEERHMSRVEDLHNDVWGSEGPDCHTQPVLAGS